MMLNNRISNEKNINKKKELIAAIQDEFPLRKYSEFDKFFPFCNDYGFEEIIKICLRYTRLKDKKVRVSLVFGESNFISLLPALSYISDVLLLADVNPIFHEHRQFLLDCFIASGTPQEFKSKYFLSKNPAIGEEVPSCDWYGTKPLSIYDLKFCLEFQMNSVGKYHFLASQKNFDNCKIALSKMTLVPIHFNISKMESCQNLNTVLHQYHAELNFCNFTNIYEYNDRLKESVKYLLKGYENPLIISSSRNREKDGDSLPRTILNLGLNDYLNTDMNKAYTLFNEYIEHMNVRWEYLAKQQQSETINNHFYLKKSITQENSEPYSHATCCIAVFCNKYQMSKIIKGELDINSFLVSKAYDVEDDFKDNFESFKSKNIDKAKAYRADFDNYWIVTFKSTKDNIKKLLSPAKYVNNDVRIHNHLMISSCIIRARKMDGNVTIEKSDRIQMKYLSTASNGSPKFTQKNEALNEVLMELKLITTELEQLILENRANKAAIPVVAVATSYAKTCSVVKSSIFNKGHNQDDLEELINRQGEVVSQKNLVSQRIRQFSQ